MTASFASLGIATRQDNRPEQRVPCPQCARGACDDALGVNVETGVFHCFRCGWSGRASEGAQVSAPRVTRLDAREVVERKRARLRRIWGECVDLAAPNAFRVRRYLESRALGAILREPPRSLRAHPALEYFDGARAVGGYPAMVAVLRGVQGTPITLHVTYLRADGGAKANVASPRKVLSVPVRGATKGAAIRLHEPRRGVLGIAEGIETALSLHLIQKVPVWAAFCADNLTRVQIPASVHELHIGVDVDESGTGESAASALVGQLTVSRPDMKVWLVHPEGEGPRDLNDELRRRVFDGAA